ncbi:MAG: adenine phosphoribosyltransferase [Planctomycetota bacterium]|nr:adenine phosphoribosyltransferase [Planctomycetota bacterium]
MNLERFIRNVPDFPKKGIIFKDITTLVGNADALRETVNRLAAPFAKAGIDKVVGIESRGFIFGAAVAVKLGAGFVPIRKPGKLPAKTISKSYQLEYGAATVELHADAIEKGQKVLVIDDVLATGGTMAAACDLVSQEGGQIVAVAVVVELCFLDGRKILPGLDVQSLIKVVGE